MNKLRSLSSLLVFLMAFVVIEVCAQIQVQSLWHSGKWKIPSSPPMAFSSVITPRVSPYNEKDTDIVIATIGRYKGKVSSRLILDNLKKRLPEAKVHNLNVDRIINYLLRAFKDDEDAVYKIIKFRERSTS